MSRWCSNQLSYEPISIFQRLALCNDALAPVAISLKNALEAPKERHSKGSALKNQDLGHMASSRAFSVDWPKERARRQYEQYGEREATQGKSLKNALKRFCLLADCASAA